MKDLIQRSLAIGSAAAGLLLAAPAWGQPGASPGGIESLEMAGQRAPSHTAPTDAGACTRLAASFEARNTMSPSRREQLVQECLANLRVDDIHVAQQPTDER